MGLMVAAEEYIFFTFREYGWWQTKLEQYMPLGFLVTLGDTTIDPGDAVAPSGPDSFVSATFLGRGAVAWVNGGNSTTTTGDFKVTDDGSVYFVPDSTPSAGAQGGTASVQNYSGAQPPVPCFVSGTLIDTPDGPEPVEKLSVGQYVIVKGAPPQPILWRGQRYLERTALQDLPTGFPIELKFNGGQRKLKVSPQHAIYLECENSGLLVRAQQLFRLRRLGARQMCGARRVQYHHLLLPHHQLVRANGVWCESLYPGPRACAGFSQKQREALLKFNIDSYGPPLARYAKLKDVRDLTARDLNNLLAVTNNWTNAPIALAS